MFVVKFQEIWEFGNFGPELEKINKMCGNKIANMRKCSTKFSRIFECGAVRLGSFFSGALCVMSVGCLPTALFMVFLLDSKGAKSV